jgi:hypothetical protein
LVGAGLGAELVASRVGVELVGAGLGGALVVVGLAWVGACTRSCELELVGSIGAGLGAKLVAGRVGVELVGAGLGGACCRAFRTFAQAQAAEADRCMRPQSPGQE